MSSKSKRVFSVEYKEAAVKMVIEEGRSQADVCTSLGLGSSTLCKWVRESRRGASSLEQNETTRKIKELESEVRLLKMECEILKKATALFARQLN